MFDLKELTGKLGDGLTALHNCLTHIYKEVKESKGVAEAQRRILEFEFGVVDKKDSNLLSPRRLTTLPLVFEDKTKKIKEINLEDMAQGRGLSRGFYANLGNQPFKVILVGVNDQVTNPHTLPPSTTINLTCLISKIIIEPLEGEEAYFQLYLQ